MKVVAILFRRDTFSVSRFLKWRVQKYANNEIIWTWTFDARASSKCPSPILCFRESSRVQDFTNPDEKNSKITKKFSCANSCLFRVCLLTTNYVNVQRSAFDDFSSLIWLHPSRRKGESRVKKMKFRFLKQSMRLAIVAWLLHLSYFHNTYTKSSDLLDNNITSAIASTLSNFIGVTPPYYKHTNIDKPSSFASKTKKKRL